MNMNNSYLQAYMEQVRQALAELNKRYPNLTVQKYRQHAYAISTNPQFRREIDDILDGLRKGGVVQEQ
jgi:hypothetical protein